MGKKNNKNNFKQTDMNVAPITVSSPNNMPETKVAWYNNFKIQAIIVAAIAVLCYFNTIKNEYALDDNIVILKNEYVYSGFVGIPDILSKDAFYSYCMQTNSANQLAGGRYRPLSIITFAIEQQFLGAIPASELDSVVNHAGTKGAQQTKLVHDMHIRHGFNILWFALSVMVLLYFLRYVVFRAKPFMAFITTLLFVVHPIHTEVVANVKSRDEILSLLFICLTFIFAFKYNEFKKSKFLLLGIGSYFLALLAKEYAITLIILLPLALHLFQPNTFTKAIKSTTPYFVVAFIYLLIRFRIVGFSQGVIDVDVWNNPYALATGMDKLATEIATTLNYLKLLLFPYPLSSDYSYNAIPYKSFNNPLVIASILVHLGFLLGFFYFLKKNAILAFGVATYLLNLAMICNVFYDIGGTMGERLIYHSSVGFVIIVGYLLCCGIEKLMPEAKSKIALLSIILLITIAGGWQIINRNKDWKNDFILFTKDIRVVPNSLLINANLGAAYINRADFATNDSAKNTDLRSGIVLLDKALQIYNLCLPAYVNRGVAYFRLGQPDSARANYDKIFSLIPNYNQLPDLYYNLGVYYYLHQHPTEAGEIWQRTLKLNPGYEMAKNALGVLEHERMGK